MTESRPADYILGVHEFVRLKYPNDVVRGHINSQALDAIMENALMEYGGQPIHDTVFKQAAVLMEGIIRLHPFPDGNKRTALLTAWDFLYAHDCYLMLPPDIIQFLLDIAKNKAQTNEEIAALVESVAVWLERRSADTRADQS